MAQGRDLVPEGEPRRLRALRAPDRDPLLGRRGRRRGAQVLLARPRAPLPRVLAAPLRKQGGLADVTRKPVLSQEAPQPSGGYSQGIVAGGFLYLAGQGPFDAAGNVAGATIAEQVRQVLANLD